MAEKIDLVSQLKHLYNPPRDPVLVEVPPMNFLMIDGHGDPNNSPLYQAALDALYSLAYTLKFAIKKAEGIDYRVLPPEGLWWVEDMSQFQRMPKEAWLWTMMIGQPDFVMAEWVEQARAEAFKKKGLAELEQVRFEPYAEGLVGQLMHIGPYSEEGPNIARLHAFIESQGCRLRGKHHEIYLSDVRRAAPEKLQTVIRQPAERVVR
jgi:hypothetical protein